MSDRSATARSARIGTRITQAVRRTLLAVLGFVVALGSASAQTPDLVTDRPDQTESATVVLRGVVQVETGSLFARDDSVDVFEVPGTLFRIGLGARTELRVGHAGVIGSKGRHGAGDSAVGAKVNLIETADGWDARAGHSGRTVAADRRRGLFERRRGSVVPGGVRARAVAAAVGRLQRRRRLGVVT